jgi:hypothetical protein
MSRNVSPGVRALWRHLTVAQVTSRVRDRVRTLSIQAVYDCLDALSDTGVVRRIEPAGRVARWPAGPLARSAAGPASPVTYDPGHLRVRIGREPGSVWARISREPGETGGATDLPSRHRFHPVVVQGSRFIRVNRRRITLTLLRQARFATVPPPMSSRMTCPHFRQTVRLPMSMPSSSRTRSSCPLRK